MTRKRQSVKTAPQFAAVFLIAVLSLPSPTLALRQTGVEESDSPKDPNSVRKQLISTLTGSSPVLGGSTVLRAGSEEQPKPDASGSRSGFQVRLAGSDPAAQREIHRELLRALEKKGWLKPVEDLRSRLASMSQELPADYPDQKGAQARVVKLLRSTMGWLRPLYWITSEPLENQLNPLFGRYLSEWLVPLLEQASDARTLNLLLVASPNFTEFQDAIRARGRVFDQTMAREGNAVAVQWEKEDPKTGLSLDFLEKVLLSLLEDAAEDRSRWQEAARYFWVSDPGFWITAPEESPAGKRAREAVSFLAASGWKEHAPETLARIRVFHPFREADRKKSPSSAGFVRILGYESGSIHVELEGRPLSTVVGTLVHEGTHLANEADPRWHRIREFETAGQIARLKHPFLGHRGKEEDVPPQPPSSLLDELLAYGRGSEAALWMWSRGALPFDPKKEAETVVGLSGVLLEARDGIALLRSDPKALNEAGREWLAEAEALWNRVDLQLRDRRMQVLESLRQGDEADRLTFYRYAGLALDDLTEQIAPMLLEALQGESIERLREIHRSDLYAGSARYAARHVLPGKMAQSAIAALEVYVKKLGNLAEAAPVEMLPLISEMAVLMRKSLEIYLTRLDLLDASSLAEEFERLRREAEQRYAEAQSMADAMLAVLSSRAAPSEPSSIGLAQLQEVFNQLLEEDSAMRQALESRGWVSLQPGQVGAFGYQAIGGFIVADSAKLTDASHAVIADEDLGNELAERALVWIRAGKAAPDVVKNAQRMNARRGDLLVFEEETGLTADQVKQLLVENGIEGAEAVRAVMGDRLQVRALPVFAFQLFASEDGLPPVIVLSVAVQLQDEAGNTYKLILMA